MQRIINCAFGLFAGLSLCLYCCSTLAQSPGASAADIGAGKKRAAVCFSCHAPDGIAKIAGVPHLAGQDRQYLEKALRAYREGQQRQDVTMTAMAKPLSDADIANIAAYFSLQTRMNNGQTAAQAIEIQMRIRPQAEVQLAEQASSVAPVAATVRTGEAVYQAACINCHGSGAAGAPKLGDKAAWGPRLAQGNASLLQHAMQGYKAMPAKGACSNCSDAQIKLAVEYLATKGK